MGNIVYESASQLFIGIYSDFDYSEARRRFPQPPRSWTWITARATTL
jgi:hypothetical protein